MNKFFLPLLCFMAFSVFALDSPFSAISSFYSIDEKVDSLKRQCVAEYDSGHCTTALERKIKTKLLALYDNCLIGTALHDFQKNLAEHFCFFCGDLSFYALPPSKIIEKQFAAINEAKAIAEISFRNGDSAVFYLLRTDAGWRIENIEGNYMQFGD